MFAKKQVSGIKLNIEANKLECSTCARFFPETMPTHDARYWQRMAVKLKNRTNSTRSFPNRAPPSTVASHFPRSIYPIEMTSAGPSEGKRWATTLDAKDSIVENSFFRKYCVRYNWLENTQKILANRLCCSSYCELSPFRQQPMIAFLKPRQAGHWLLINVEIDQGRLQAEFFYKLIQKISMRMKQEY